MAVNLSPTDYNYRVCTSSTRPTGVAGLQIFETDTNRVLTHDGTGWIIMSEPVQTYTPTLTQSGAITKTVTQAIYQRSNGRCQGQVFMSLTSSGTGGVVIVVGLPVATLIVQRGQLGSGVVYDGSTAYYDCGLVSYGAGGTQAYFKGWSTLAGGMGVAGMTAALVSGDQIGYHFDYPMNTRYL